MSVTTSTEVVVGDCCVFCGIPLNLWYATCPGQRVPCDCAGASVHWKRVAETERGELRLEQDAALEKARLEQEALERLFEENFF